VGDEKSKKKLFRFQDLEIWKKAVEIGNKLFDIADRLEEKKLYRFAEQVRAAGLSMSNNISEGSGSLSRKEFSQFLNIARRSTFENANMVIVFEMRGLVTREEKDEILQDLEEECKMISGFIRSLGKG
jgi:four helix bundle protein